MEKPFFDPVEEVNHTPEREEAIAAWWQEAGIFRRTIQVREDSPDFVFFEGPPTANGLPGVHHVLNRTFKDLVCRLKTMEGYRVRRKAGWDTHGLPVEIEVEKRLGLSHKSEIEAYGVAEFNAQCRESVMRYENGWRTLTERIGFWVDMDDPYFTFSNEYIESVWWILSRFFQEGLIYQGNRILPYCPRCGTPLSSHEVSLGYEEAEDPSIYVRFPISTGQALPEVLATGGEGIPRSLLVWTTTPWTLLSNTFVVVHPDLEYVELEVDRRRPNVHRSLDEKYGEGYSGRVRDGARIEEGRERFILARGRALMLFGKPDSEEYREGVSEAARFSGSELIGLRYERPFDLVEMDTSRTQRVFAADYVTDEEGTGIVHSSPAYGEDDFETGRREQMPVVTPVDDEGAFTTEVTPWAGVFVKAADPSIIEALASDGLLWRADSITHTYPFCWRCESPLLYMARPSWYIRTTAIRDRLLSANRTVNWIPREIGSGRMGEWLENNQDWAISRDRYWGTPLPIWRCDDEGCGHLHCIGSLSELAEHADQAIRDDLDLHKPFVDEFTWECPECGRGRMYRTPEVIDVWFDSGAMPYAQWHYPFENREVFDQQFPADYISEAIDQTRGWFYSLLVIGVFLFDRPAFKNCLVAELVLDRNGQKMSKSRGNTVDPWEVIRAWGADPLRWYLITNSPPWMPTRFDVEGVAEASRKFFGTLHNTHAFFALYANIDGFDPDGAEIIPVADRSVLDRWLLSRLHTTTRAVRKQLGRFDITRSARTIQDFIIEDLSNWYVRRSRRRFWKGETGPDKTSAYQTLHEVLVTSAALLAPFIPFTSEELWRNLQARREGTEESVHLSDYPAGNDSVADPDLERDMAFARAIVALGRAARSRAGIRVRQPLRGVRVAAPEEWQRHAIDRLGWLVAEELNVKTVVSVESTAAFTRLVAEPQYNRLGPKFGKEVNRAAELIGELPEDSIDALARGAEATIRLDGATYRITPGEVRLKEVEPEGVAVEREGEYAVAIDTRLDEPLRLEGLAREFTARIQALRRQLDYKVTDRVRLGYSASTALTEAIKAHADHVAEETLAVELRDRPVERADREEEWELDGEHVMITIARDGA